jgi:hypothetical protein
MASRLGILGDQAQFDQRAGVPMSLALVLADSFARFGDAAAVLFGQSYQDAYSGRDSICPHERAMLTRKHGFNRWQGFACIDSHGRLGTPSPSMWSSKACLRSDIAVLEGTACRVMNSVREYPDVARRAAS